ncbi:DUF4870 domain-containing protein [Agrilactobacillus fermenti]|uniref:DUF4870 domain-containing protein n=1 Tax=Agrilactobacillus fermenti TaxID=2586909 RepID=UPI001E2F87BD|nr:DUF4870 domain-containing protein [Agrilactobacillus fermenti]MCD2256197.1 DUF4870 domain-containing protein [Agrilactobacillus fermenti]
MNGDKVLSGLSYISILFAPILFPIAVWLLSSNVAVQSHAKNALILHILPTFITIGLIVVIGINGLLMQDAQATGMVAIVLIGVIAILDFFLYIYNLYKGIKILVSSNH